MAGFGMRIFLFWVGVGGGGGGSVEGCCLSLTCVTHRQQLGLRNWHLCRESLVKCQALEDCERAPGTQLMAQFHSQQVFQPLGLEMQNNMRQNHSNSNNNEKKLLAWCREMPPESWGGTVNTWFYFLCVQNSLATWFTGIDSVAVCLFRWLV